MIYSPIEYHQSTNHNDHTRQTRRKFHMSKAITIISSAVSILSLAALTILAVKKDPQQQTIQTDTKMTASTNTTTSYPGAGP